MIAQHFHVSLLSLADANRLDWRKPLLIGAVLRVPAAGRRTAGGPRHTSFAPVTR